MPNPPSFNDLKRFKKSFKKSFKVIYNGVEKITPAPPFPPLPPFFLEPSILGIENSYIPSSDLIGTESLSGLSGYSFYSDNRLNFNKYRYFGRNFNESTVFFLPSLFFVDNNFITLSKTLIFDPILGENSIRQETYNIEGEVENIFYSLSTLDFNRQKIDAFTNTNSITGTIFQTNSSPFTTTVNVTSFLSSGDIFLNGNIDGQSYNDIIYNIEFQNDYITNDRFYYNQNSLDTKTVNFAFDSITTDSFTIHFSAIRNDGIPGLNITSIEIPVNIFLAPNPERVFSDRSIAATWQTISGVPNPEGEEDKFRFLNNPTNISAEWNTEWWGYNSRELYNFSGVTYKAIGFSSENNITLINPKHGVCNEHWGNDPRAGDIGFFYDHTTGNAISAKIVSAHNTRFVDIRMVKFDRDLTAEGDIKVYKIPKYESLINEDTLCTIYQGGNGPFGTGSSDRHAGLGTQYPVQPWFNFQFGTKLRATDLWSVSSIFENTFFALSSLAVGDSSSPSFIILDDDILLTSTIWTAGGSGPNYGLSSTHTVLSAGLETLGNSEGYVLSTVSIG